MNCIHVVLFVIFRCEDEDKFLLLYTLVKLNLICGKSLVFVSSVDRCYK